jgi:hypothetical protein
MSEVVYNILENLAIYGLTISVCYICADGAKACMLYGGYQKSIEDFQRTGNRSILERQKEAVSKVDPHSIGILTQRSKKDILKEIEQLSRTSP